MTVDLLIEQRQRFTTVMKRDRIGWTRKARFANITAPSNTLLKAPGRINRNIFIPPLPCIHQLKVQQAYNDKPINIQVQRGKPEYPAE
ncbi:MAG: hypothetical protein WDO19_22000 [Bacteroidota bacterium]